MPPPGFNSKSKLEHQARFQQNPDRNVGLLNSRNGTHVENNKPEWDYIIPICVCSHGNCVDCVAPKDGHQKVLQRDRSSDPRKQGMKESFRNTSEDTQGLSKSISSSKPNQIHNNRRQIVLNGNIETQTPPIHQKNVSSIISSVDSVPTAERNEWKQISSTIVHHSPDKIHAVSKLPLKNTPVAMQRKDKTEKPNFVRQESSGLTRTELTVLPLDVNNSDLFMRESGNTVGHCRTVKASQKDSRVVPVPAPRTRVPRVQQHKKQDVDAQETEVKPQNLDSDASANSLRYVQYPVWRRVAQTPRPEICRQGGTSEVSVDRLLKKTMFRPPLCEIKNEDCVDITDPEGKTRLENGQLTKQTEPSRKPVFNLKPKSKSLSSVDMRRPDGLKKPALLQIMDLDISVNKVPRLVQNGHLDFFGVKNEQSVDTECYLEETQGLTSLHNGHIERLNEKGIANLKNFGIEQSVDGDDLEIDAEHVYDHIYEDIVDYENLPPLSTANMEVANNCQNQPLMYEDDGVYEYPDVFTETLTNSKEFLQRYINATFYIKDV